jgi:phosphopantothenoylcysteine decarboxylase/phosphopantothenate--cysteine ligase
LAQTDKQPLAGYEVLLCITGGIACYKSADLASKLVQQGCGVSVAMTDAAREFIAPLTFQALTGRRVYTSLWQSSRDYSSQHISLSQRADLMIVAPATANILAKIASGLADDLVSTMALSACGACKLLLCPAMNSRMFQAPATQANLATLKAWQMEILGPASGRLACNTVGPGRMVEPGEILSTCLEMLQSSPAKSLRT